MSDEIPFPAPSPILVELVAFIRDWQRQLAAAVFIPEDLLYPTACRRPRPRLVVSNAMTAPAPRRFCSRPRLVVDNTP